MIIRRLTSIAFGHRFPRVENAHPLSSGLALPYLSNLGAFSRGNHPSVSSRRRNHLPPSLPSQERSATRVSGPSLFPARWVSRGRIWDLGVPGYSTRLLGGTLFRPGTDLLLGLLLFYHVRLHPSRIVSFLIYLC